MTALERRYARLLIEQRIHADHARQAAERGDAIVAEMLCDLAIRRGQEAREIERQVSDERDALAILGQRERRASHAGILGFFGNLREAFPAAMAAGRWE